MKTYHITSNIGKAKYVVSFHNGEKVHSDNSPFFEIAIFSNIKALKKFELRLLSEGYTACSTSLPSA